jgi:Alpha-galactosidase
VNPDKIPGGLGGLSRKIEAMGMKFGLWFEPEMVNKDSMLYRRHPEWVLSTPNRKLSQGRNQYVLDFSSPEVVDYIYGMIAEILRNSAVSYIKWDMNRYMTECFSAAHPPQRQGEIPHRYILGVYSLYNRLTKEFPEILFEGCAAGGARFDPGLLYYAPQSWVSDNTDAVERLKIQYGSSLVYPLSCMGAHVSAVPNHQMLRTTPLETRVNTALFGVFGYELDPNKLTDAEKDHIQRDVAFVKKYRGLVCGGDFYRLISPFEQEACAWMVVSEDRRQALAGYYKILNKANPRDIRLKFRGLCASFLYEIESKPGLAYYGDELMYAGILIDSSEFCLNGADFSSVIFLIKKRE